MATTNNSNDEQILQLKEVVKKKREELEKLKKEKKGFNTKLILDFFGQKYNFHVLSEEAGKLLLVRLGMYDREAKLREVELTIDGYPISDWMEDIETKLRESDIRVKERKLKAFEEKLEEKLSEDTKTKMEIDSISDMLNDFKI
jgi:hypothetical protein